MTNETTFKVVRTIRGELRAMTRFTLDASERRELHITTDKGYRGGVECDARVVRISLDGVGYEHAFGLGRNGSGDFSRTILSDRDKRATVKAIEDMHRAGLAMADAVLEEARAFYAAQAARKAAEVNA